MMASADFFPSSGSEHDIATSCSVGARAPQPHPDAGLCICGSMTDTCRCRARRCETDRRGLSAHPRAVERGLCSSSSSVFCFNRPVLIGFSSHVPAATATAGGVAGAVATGGAAGAGASTGASSTW